MAFEMTHMRFAMDLAPRLGIKDFPSYLAGSIYPDSRYVTGIGRDMTHGEDVPSDPFAAGLDDFKRGWAAHVLYDRLAIQKYKDLTPWPENKIVGFGQEWVFTTAEKIVEDLQSYDMGTVPREILEAIVPPAPVWQEDRELLAVYYGAIKTLFTERPELDDYRRVLQGWKVDTEVIDRLMAKTAQLMDDRIFAEKISGIYPKIFEAYGK